MSFERYTRLFARVEETLPIRVRPLTAEEAATRARHYTAFGSSSEPRAPDQLPEGDASGPERLMLGVILARLDRLERLVGRIAEKYGVGEDEGDAAWLPGETMTLSGGGLGAVLPERLDEGVPVELELVLPGEGSATIRATGRVASVLEPTGSDLADGRHRVGIAFTGIHPADRETLVRFTFRLQRAHLRERRAETV